MHGEQVMEHESIELHDNYGARGNNRDQHVKNEFNFKCNYMMRFSIYRISEYKIYRSPVDMITLITVALIFTLIGHCLIIMFGSYTLLKSHNNHDTIESAIKFLNDCPKNPVIPSILIIYASVAIINDMIQCIKIKWKIDLKVIWIFQAIVGIILVVMFITRKYCIR